ncbi:intradiol ring-cleavage dioxygenase [Pseudofrankia asymbiotica]|uniref:3,4-dioxygenase subunit beta n=1 Tax=Pseudofrankia asymbiotica TaxID=1834516 RepID=A0A1V2I677_9ACTN|nr:intradiol ring-cleavage dioxygenase [Pseudofrankia asymbiotica]ONH26601.1 3,4-dioxygenase subunit beta [Pseudofrankia asymbiotica]
MAKNQRPDGIPSYEGRPLARPPRDVVDQGLAFDIGTLLSRRRLLSLVGLGAATAGLAACGSGSGSATSTGASHGSATAGSTASTSTSAASGEIPQETAGPYPGDGSNGPDVLQQSGVVRGDIRSSFGTASGTAGGVPMTVELTIADLAGGGGAFTGVAVYVWHCDREGRYSMYSKGVTDQNYLRGVQIADASGKVRFTSIFPACYSGRWPHVHFEAYPDQASITDATKAIATSQVALPKDICDQVYAQAGYEASVTNLARVGLTSDGVFGDDGGAHQLATVTGAVTTGYTVSLAVGVDTTTSPGSGQSAGMPGGPSPGGQPG